VTRSRLSQHHTRQKTSDSPSDHDLATLHYGEPTPYNNYQDPITTTTTPQRHNGTPEPLSDDENELPGGYRATPTLKGIIYPGMALFDSATAIRKRRRNQKKSSSVLEALEANSLEIEPTEHVWTPGGTLKKSKEISGLPSSSSPPVSPNQHHVPIYRPSSGRIDSRHSWANQDGISRYNSYTDQRLEDALTYGNYDTRKKKRALGVYHDEDEPLTGTLSQPVQMSVLTSSQNRGATRRRPSRQYDENNDDEDEDDYEPRSLIRKRKAAAAQSNSRHPLRRRMVSDNVVFDNTGRRVMNPHYPQDSRASSYGQILDSKGTHRYEGSRSLRNHTQDFQSSYHHQLPSQMSQPPQAGDMQRLAQPNPRRHHPSLSIEALVNSTHSNPMSHSMAGNGSLPQLSGTFGHSMPQVHDLPQPFSFGPNIPNMHTFMGHHQNAALVGPDFPQF
jgi:hypothetical protein